MPSASSVAVPRRTFAPSLSISVRRVSLAKPTGRSSSKLRRTS